ncbi:hypothetical protein OAN33_06830, partial [Flavobacteriales bacterium]|nr:hypothetical protein [Flavobacteriales bacterium]
MKNLLLFGTLLFSLNLYSQAVDYGSQNTTSTCDGYAYLDENSFNSSTGYVWYTANELDSSLIVSIGSNPQDSLYSLCPGLFALSYHDSLYTISNWDTLYYYFTIDSSYLCANFDLTTTVTNVTTVGSCDGGVSANVTGANGPLSYDWSNSGTTQAINNLCSGSYSLTVTDSVGCVAYSSSYVYSQPCVGMTLNINTIESTTPGSCDGTATAVVSGANGPVTYNWSNSGTTQSINNLCAGFYSVTVTDSLNCSVFGNEYVLTDSSVCNNINVSISLTNSSAVGACDGSATAIVSGSVGPVIYSWSNSGTTQIINNLCAGFYSVTVLDSIGCESSGSISIQPQP